MNIHLRCIMNTCKICKTEYNMVFYSSCPMCRLKEMAMEQSEQVAPIPVEKHHAYQRVLAEQRK